MSDSFSTIHFQIIAAFILDLIAGDPQWRFHPVRLIGKFINYLEYLLRRLPLPERLMGLFLALGVVSGVYIITYKIMCFSKQWSPVCEVIVGFVIIYFAISIKCLADEAKKVISMLRVNDIRNARSMLSRIVGRDTADLNEEQIMRACIETVAEGCVDGILSPLFYCFIGGPVATMTYRAVNTLDSMVGYKNEKYRKVGWASARLDDIANYIPARLSALFIPAASFLCGYGFFQSLRMAFREGGKHESPNSGISEAAFAGALEVQLGGPSTYGGEVVDKPYIGDNKKQITLKSLEMALRLMVVTSVLFLVSGLGFLLIVKSLVRM
ncbi:MAG: cobalamin biosynthesis protein CobD [Candidatus Kuenenia sp.]|nr:cobalamin biosynthesis protein CobD [Candidatus Kuenenia hertensis]